MSRDLLGGHRLVRRLTWRAMRIVARDLTPGGALLLARGVADLLWFLDAPGRRTVADNLAPLIPDHDARQRAVRRCFRACAEQLALTLRLDRRPLRDPATIRVIDPWQVFAATPVAGPLTGPLIIAASHVDWDVVLTVLQAQRLVTDLAVVALPSGDAWIDCELNLLRACAGARTLPWTSAARASLGHLRAGGALGVLADRDYSPTAHGGLDVRVAGRTRRIPTGPAELAYRSGALVVPVAVVHGALVVGRTFRPCTRAAVETVTRAVADFHLRAVATAPGRWVAFHRIWE